MTDPESPGVRQRAGCGLRSCVLVGLVGLCLVYLGLRGLGAFLITGDPVKTSDAVVALGGGGEHRVEQAVLLIQQKRAQWLLITEPGEVKVGDGLGSKFYQSVAIEGGLSPNAIMISDQVDKSTYDEARSVRKMMEQHQLKSVIVVTDPFHTQRTRMIFRNVFRDSGLTVRVHPVVGHWYRSGTWFLSPEGWSNTVREYVKMIGYLTGLSKTLE